MRRRRLFAALAAAAPLSLARAQTGPQPVIEPLEELVIVTRDGTRHRFRVEVARDPEQQRVGLMFRPEVPADGGMLFDWGSPRESSMWMRNTIASLDMVFITAEGRVRRIAERTVPYSLAPINSGGPVRATLELAAGTAERLGIRVGDLVEHPIFGTAR